MLLVTHKSEGRWGYKVYYHDLWNEGGGWKIAQDELVRGGWRTWLNSQFVRLVYGKTNYTMTKQNKPSPRNLTWTPLLAYQVLGDRGYYYPYTSAIIMTSCWINLRWWITLHERHACVEYWSHASVVYVWQLIPGVHVQHSTDHPNDKLHACILHGH